MTISLKAFRVLLFAGVIFRSQPQPRPLPSRRPLHRLHLPDRAPLQNLFLNRVQKTGHENICEPVFDPKKTTSVLPP